MRRSHSFRQKEYKTGKFSKSATTRAAAEARDRVIDQSAELDCYELDAVQKDADGISVIVMCRFSGAETLLRRQRLQNSQRIFIRRLASMWRAQGTNITRVYSCIRFRRSRDRIKEEFLDRHGNIDELRLYNTLRNRLQAGSQVHIIQRGLDGITDRASLTSWLRY